MPLRAIFSRSFGRGEMTGLKQSFLKGALWAWRCQRLRTRALTWQDPTPQAQAAFDADPVVSRFGDAVIATTTIAGRDAWVLENDWHGFPDPPRFALFVFDTRRRFHIAANFADWPADWVMPPAFAAREAVG